MEKGIILYQSRYGATEKYAKWLTAMTGFECMERKKADIRDIKRYDTIVLGGGIYASGISGLSFFRKNKRQLKGKKLAVFCVGASPYDASAMEEIRRRNFKEDLADIPCFYCRGAWQESRMSLKDKALCAMLKKAVARQDPAGYEPWQKALMEAIGKDCDWTDQAYLIPLMEYLQI